MPSSPGLCCGAGGLTKDLVEGGLRVTGVDNSKGMMAAAQVHLHDLQGATLELLKNDSGEGATREPNTTSSCAFRCLNSFPMRNACWCFFLHALRLADCYCCPFRTGKACFASSKVFCTDTRDSLLAAAQASHAAGLLPAVPEAST